MEGYDGIPEFDISDRTKWDMSRGEKLPFLRFHSHIAEDELLPIPDEHTLNYQQVHWELERWSIFKALPTLINWDRNVHSMIDQIKNGHIKAPDFYNEINPPSLWTYYETLPSWARASPIVRNVMMAMEYHHPGLHIREKENALNYACSFLRPVDSVMREMLVDACMSSKI